MEQQQQHQEQPTVVQVVRDWARVRMRNEASINALIDELKEIKAEACNIARGAERNEVTAEDVEAAKRIVRR